MNANRFRRHDAIPPGCQANRKKQRSPAEIRQGLWSHAVEQVVHAAGRRRNVEKDRRRKRRALSVEELHWLLATTNKSGEEQFGMKCAPVQWTSSSNDDDTCATLVELPISGRIQADGEGFEPPHALRREQFSRLPPSTTRPPIQVVQLYRRCRTLGRMTARTNREMRRIRRSDHRRMVGNQTASVGALFPRIPGECTQNGRLEEHTQHPVHDGRE